MGKRRDPTLEDSHCMSMRMPVAMHLALMRQARLNGRCVAAELREIIGRDLDKGDSV